jgi:hypothetical protein
VPTLPGGGRRAAGGAALRPLLLPRLPADGPCGRPALPDLPCRGVRIFAGRIRCSGDAGDAGARYRVADRRAASALPVWRGARGRWRGRRLGCRVGWVRSGGASRGAGGAHGALL